MILLFMIRDMIDLAYQILYQGIKFPHKAAGWDM